MMGSRRIAEMESPSNVEVRLGATMAPIEDFLQPHREWLEEVLGCAWSETITFEINFPFSHLVLEDLLSGVCLDRRCIKAGPALRPLVDRWTLAPRTSPRIELTLSRFRSGAARAGYPAWDPHWK